MTQITNTKANENENPKGGGAIQFFIRYKAGDFNVQVNVLAPVPYKESVNEEDPVILQLELHDFSNNINAQHAEKISISKDDLIINEDGEILFGPANTN